MPPHTDPVQQIFTFDLRSGQQEGLLKTYSVSKTRSIEGFSYLMVKDTLFFLSCWPVAGQEDSRSCRLKKISLSDPQKQKATVFFDFDPAFTKAETGKSIMAYHPEHHSLILTESTIPQAYELAISDYYELYLEPPRLRKLTKVEIHPILEEIRNTPEGQCYKEVLQGGIPQEKEKTKLEKPFFIPIGCYKGKELEALLGKPHS